MEIIVAMAVIIMGVLFVWIARTAKHPAETNPPKTNQRAAVVTNVAPTSLPKDFPADVPFFKLQTIVENFNVDNGLAFEAVRTYTSSLSEQESLTNYQKYFLSNGWRLQSMTTTGSVIRLVGRKGSAILFAQFDLATSSASSKVTLSFTYPK